MNKTYYKYLLFDADNTILDFNQGEYNSLKEVLSSTQLKFSEDIYRDYHEINDNLWKILERGGIEREQLRLERFHILFEHNGIADVDYCLSRFVATQFLAVMKKQSIMMPNAKEVLQELSSRYNIFVITNGSESVQLARFRVSPLMQYIEKLYISQQIGVEKPNKAFFDAVINDIGDCDPTKYLVIGDSLTSDIKGAENAGIDSCYFDHFGKGTADRSPKYIIRSLMELTSIL